MAKRKVVSSDIWFNFVMPEKNAEGSTYANAGKMYKAQLLVLYVERNSMRVRLFNQDGSKYYAGPIDVPADQFYEQMAITSIW